MKARSAGSGAASTVAGAATGGSAAWQSPASRYASGEKAMCEMVPSAFITLQITSGSHALADLTCIGTQSTPQHLRQQAREAKVGDHKGAGGRRRRGRGRPAGPADLAGEDGMVGKGGGGGSAAPGAALGGVPAASRASKVTLQCSPCSVIRQAEHIWVPCAAIACPLSFGLPPASAKLEQRCQAHAPL